MNKHQYAADSDSNNASTKSTISKSSTISPSKSLSSLPFPHQYILAPMVGASELAFRLLCRKYGAQLAYTPMMSAHRFAHDPEYRREEFQTCPADRPLVCHFSANTPHDFRDAVRAAAPYCDAVDLNLGCPQRTAYLGHFGSYLLDTKDRTLVCDIVRAGANAGITPPIPIFCKIRLLNTLEETIELCQQLVAAGASLIAVHARYRASWERQGPGARDGPALLDQVTAIRKEIRADVPIIANGNVITYQDVQHNLESTGADGIMSAEGILDNPALFLSRYGTNEGDGDKSIVISSWKKKKEENHANSSDSTSTSKKKRKLLKKLSKIEKIERKPQTELSAKEKDKLATKSKVMASLEKLDKKETNFAADAPETDQAAQTKTVSLSSLYESACDPLNLALEYMDIVRVYPVAMRSVIFHIRRILKADLTKYQLMEECLTCPTLDRLSSILDKIQTYRHHPASFQFDREKAQREKQALERKKQQEGKRKEFEARMIRKAKREGREDREYYLHIGAAVPTQAIIDRLKGLSPAEALQCWKKDHAQHCMNFHMNPDGCKRGRTCAFLHVDASCTNNFDEKDEVAG